MTTSFFFLFACLSTTSVRARCLDGVDRLLDDQLDADGGGEMEHDVRCDR